MVNTDIQSIVTANNIFTADLYSKLAKEKDNLFVSPFSILSALYMVYAGGRNKTATQMERVLHVKLPQDKFHRIYSKISRVPEVSKGYELTLANALSMKFEK